MVQKTDYVQMAQSYADIMARVKELEKEAAPFKDALLDYAEKMGQPRLDLDAVTIERRETVKATYDKKKLNGKMFDRLMKLMPKSLKVDVKVPKGEAVEGEAVELLEAIGYGETAGLNYAIRLS